MARLYQVGPFVALVICTLSASSYGAEYCSLTVQLKVPPGDTPEHTYVTVVENNGRIVRKESTGAYVQFCDLGLGPVTVKVGLSACNQVIVTDVPLERGKPYNLFVYYDFGWCLKCSVPIPNRQCNFLFRISDEEGKWLENATVHAHDLTSRMYQTDSAGRANTFFRPRTPVVVDFTAEGFTPRSGSYSCAAPAWRHEETIVLKRIPKP